VSEPAEPDAAAEAALAIEPDAAAAAALAIEPEAEVSDAERVELATERALSGNLAKGGAKLKVQHKLFVRDRLALLLDAGSFVEDSLLANSLGDDLPADGVVTGRGRVDGRPVCVMANDPTVKAGSWGARTVEKIVRLTEYALEHELPVFYLVDSAGARITDQVELFPGRRGAGRIFYNEVRLSGRVPQICCLFGPSAAGGAYIPAFCDVVFMVEGNASMYLGSPRMAEMVVGELTDLEEMGGARMHATVSGCGDNLVVDDAAAIEAAKDYFSYLPGSWREVALYSDPQPPSGQLTSTTIPASDSAGYSIYSVIDGIIDAGSFFELKPLFAPELVIGWARLDGRSIGIVANNPASRGGVLFTDSADKAARFIWCADAFNVPLLFLADVPGFMIGTKVEREGIIRHGAKMITAVCEATVPKISVILRKAYGAGLYAMAGPAFAPDACLALPSAKIAVMGPEPAVNAVFANRIAAITDETERASYVTERRREYEMDVDLLRLASDLVVDAVVQPDQLRAELVTRFSLAESKTRWFTDRRHGVPPV
jgi:methylmalonyl-CoA decarboxylase subunit alpha